MRSVNLKALAATAVLMVLAAAPAARASVPPCASLSNGERCEGEVMPISPSTGRTVWGLSPKNTSGGALQMLTSNGSAVLTTNLPFTDTLTVRARGGQSCNGWPHMTLSVDGRQVFAKDVAQLEWKSYTVPVTVNAGTHTLAVGFDNDYSTGTCDRNLRVDYVDATDPPAPEPVPGPGGSGVFRAFSSASPWNIPAVLKGPVGSNNPYASQFTSYANELQISGTPDNPDYSSPVFFAQPGDPT